LSNNFYKRVTIWEVNGINLLLTNTFKYLRNNFIKRVMIKFRLRILGMIVAIACLSTSLVAQISGGGRIGVNLANLHGSSVSNNSMLVGYNIGGIANYKLTDLLSGDIADIMSIQAEFSFQSKGTQRDYTTLEGQTAKAKQVFSYIQIPVLAKFTFETNGDLKYFGEGGFFMGALFGLTFDGEKSYDTDGNPNTDPRKFREEYSGFDLGATLGGGVIMPFGGRRSPWEAYADLRYSLGLTNIGHIQDKTPEAFKPSLENVKTNTLSILIGVTYTF